MPLLPVMLVPANDHECGCVHKKEATPFAVPVILLQTKPCLHKIAVDDKVFVQELFVVVQGLITESADQKQDQPFYLFQILTANPGKLVK